MGSDLVDGGVVASLRQSVCVDRRRKRSSESWTGVESTSRRSKGPGSPEKTARPGPLDSGSRPASMALIVLTGSASDPPALTSGACLTRRTNGQ